MGWRVRAVRGATTVEDNSAQAIQEAVAELLDLICTYNPIDPVEIINTIFTITSDLNAAFPAATARQRPGWDQVPLLDMQAMDVPGSPSRCIRVLLQFNTELLQQDIHHVYLRRARHLRPDLASPQREGVPSRL